VRYAEVGFYEGAQAPDGDWGTELAQGAAEQTQVHGAHHLRILVRQRAEGAGAQPQLHILAVGNQFGFETEFGERRGDVMDGLIGGDRLGGLLVAAGERLTGLLGHTSGDRAAGRKVAGEDIGEQLETIQMLAAAGGRGMDEPGAPGATPGAGAAAGEAGIDENPEMETHRVGMQTAVRSDLGYIQRGTAAT
jgi:hypothetical protein